MRRRPGTTAILLALTISALGCTAAESPPAPEAEPTPTVEDDRAAIDALMDGLAAAFANGSIEELMSVYTDDVIYMGAGGPAIHGAADMRAANDPVSPYAFTMHNDEVVVTGDWGYARGTYDGNDQYLMVVRRDADGEWRIAREIWNIAPDEE